VSQIDIGTTSPQSLLDKWKAGGDTLLSVMTNHRQRPLQCNHAKNATQRRLKLKFGSRSNSICPGIVQGEDRRSDCSGMWPEIISKCQCACKGSNQYLPLSISFSDETAVSV